MGIFMSEAQYNELKAQIDEANEAAAKFQRSAYAAEELAKERGRKLDLLPQLIIDTVTEEYGAPCDEGLAAFMDAAGLNMPNRKKMVTLSWTETVNYYAEEEVECEWDGSEYVVPDRAQESLRESAYDSAEYGDTYDYEVKVES